MPSSRPRFSPSKQNKLRSRRAGKRGNQTHRKRSFSLGFESLEPRLLLAVDAFVDNKGTLSILGSESDDQIVATVDSVSEEIIIATTDTKADTPVRIPLSDFHRIELAAAGGNDFVNIIDADRTLDKRQVTLDLSGGDGDNIVFLSTEAVTPEEIRPFQSLAKLGSELEDIATQIAAATQNGLVTESQKLISDATTRVIDVTESLQDHAEQEVFGPAHALLQVAKTDLLGVAQELLTEMQDVGASAGELSDRMEATEETHLDAAEAITNGKDQRSLEATGRKYDEAIERYSTQATEFADEGMQLANEGLALAESATELGEQAQQLADGSVADLEARADDLAQRLHQIEQSTDALQTELQPGLNAVGDRVLGIAERLQDVNLQLRKSLGQYAEKLVDAAAKIPQTKNARAKCQPAPTQVFNGGNGFDFFFPLSAPASSWLINGGGGMDILFGGFAGDQINGGGGTDFIFGLRGSDVIHGDDGIDFLFGEFVVDIPLITGDDCVFGDAGIDLVVGDNGVELFSGTPGGDDELHGGDSFDIVVGDDISDVFDPMHAGGNDEIYGDGGIDALFGTGGDDTLEGGQHIDFMMGGGDDDTLYGIDNTFIGDGWAIPGTTIVLGNLQFGNLGDDTVYGGDGLDVQFGNAGDDEMYGKDYVDVMFGQQDEDTMYGESGGTIFNVSGYPVRLGNFMFGGAAVDEMWGGGDLDVMLGNAADDTMHGFDGTPVPFGIDADWMLGGDGDDIMHGDAEELTLLTSSDFMFGQAGDDTMNGGKQTDFMVGGDGIDTMNGDSNSILLPLSADFMLGGPGDDIMDGGNSLDIMLGNAGDDTMNGDDESLFLVSPDLMFGGTGSDTMNGGASGDLMSGGDDDDNMLGDSNVLAFLGSTDMMFGGAGDDIMDGGNSLDFMLGNRGDDRMQGDNNSVGLVSLDFMLGNSGDDWMNGGNSLDFMSGGVGSDTMLGDNNLWWQLLSFDFMMGNENCDTMFGGASNDFMFGNSGVDNMDGQRGLDIMLGNEDSDIMNGGNGWDLMWGNGGTDVIRGGNGWDIASGGSEDDRIFGENGWDVLIGNSGNDLIHGNAGWDIISGNDHNDCLHGDAGWDAISGNSGDDCITGGDGWDSLRGNSGNDHLMGDAGSDRLRGNSGDDDLEGGAGADRLRGNSGDDELWGGAGIDRLYGGSGFDTLWGGSGWLDILIGGPNTNQGGPDASGVTCTCVHAPVEPCTKFDFGDAHESYGTLLPVGARHVINGPRLGNHVDWELNGQPSPAADGDDLAVLDDEDGVTISTLFVGATTAVPVDLQNASNAILNIWVDNNADGDFADAGEHVNVNTPLISGSNLVNITLPATALPGSTFARFRVTSAPGIGATGEALDGEVEDYQIKVIGWDYGDAPVSYGTLNINSGARHALSGPFLGSSVDGEADGQPSISADGDDMNGVDDEDGVIISGLVAGMMGTATVNVGSPSTAFLDAWIDFNQDGMFDDSAGSSEIIANSLPVSGSGNTISFAVPPTAASGATYARFRVSTTGGLGPLGSAQNGEVEDYQAFIKPEPQMDYGDAPDSYQTLRSSHGPRHRLGGPVLGLVIDAEPDGQPGPAAFLDDNTNLADEDGVTLSGMVAGGSATANVFLSSASTAYLDAWVDFNADGDFVDIGEQIFSSQLIVSSMNTLAFSVPATATAGATYARFRVSSTGGLTHSTPEIGPAPDGEVQDIRTGIQSPPQEKDFGDAPDSYGTLDSSNGAWHVFGGPVLGTLLDNEPDGQPSIFADGDDNNNLNDEDGVVGSVTLAGGGQLDVTMSGAPTALLYGWIDFDQDGEFDDTATSNERIFSGLAIPSGTTSLAFAVPPGTLLGETYARFRVISESPTPPMLPPTGFGGPGEVEDYLVVVKQQIIIDDDDKATTGDRPQKTAVTKAAMPMEKSEAPEPKRQRVLPVAAPQSDTDPQPQMVKSSSNADPAPSFRPLMSKLEREQILHRQFAAYFAGEQGSSEVPRVTKDDGGRDWQAATIQTMVSQISFLSSVDELVSSLNPRQINTMRVFAEPEWLRSLWMHHADVAPQSPYDELLDELIEDILG